MSMLAADQHIVEWLARDARDPSPQIREAAYDRMGRLSSTAELLAAGLRDSDPEVRGTAAANMGSLRREEVWPVLMHAARNEASDEVLGHIVRELGWYHDPSILGVLLELLNQRDREYQIRMQVASQLWRYEPDAAIPPLMEVVLGDDRDLVRFKAADSLALLDEVLPPNPACHDVWLRLADDSYLGVTTVAAKALRQEELPRVTNVLAAISRSLQDSSAYERMFALYRLSQLAPPSAIALAMPLLHDKQPGVRSSCCACLGAIRDEAAIPVLVSALRSDPEPRVQTGALLGLENYHTTEIGKMLLSVLDSGFLKGIALAILCRQLWKYPSRRAGELLQHVLRTTANLPQRQVVEDSLSFVNRFVVSGLT